MKQIQGYYTSCPISINENCFQKFNLKKLSLTIVILYSKRVICTKSKKQINGFDQQIVGERCTNILYLCIYL